jgi:hypothetical protein
MIKIQKFTYLLLQSVENHQKKQDIYYFRIPKRQEKSTFFKSKMLKTREIKKHTLYFTFLKHQKSDRLLNNHISSSFHCLKNIRIQ